MPFHHAELGRERSIDMKGRTSAEPSAWRKAGRRRVKVLLAVVQSEHEHGARREDQAADNAEPKNSQATGRDAILRGSDRRLDFKQIFTLAPF
jgi:hypothetical protein